MDFKRVSKKAKGYWYFSLVLTLILLILPACAATCLLGLPGYIIAGCALALYLIIAAVYPALEYIQWAYLITKDRIEIKKGIIFKSHNIIPAGRIQHVNIASGPIMRLFGISRVEIHTAGGVFKIMGLDKETAQQVGDTLHGFISSKLNSQKKAEPIGE
ncbi:MAG: PH domain-containing protein [Clostridia bacterium]|nr:PH domain-containing protein [Clostridia bacterium]